MVNKTKYFIIIILFFAVSFNFSQVKEKIKNKQTELSRIKTEISLLESQLKIKTTKEKQSNIALDNYNKQNFLLNTLVNRLREEEQLKQEDIEFTLHQIEYIEKEIKILQINYSKYVTSVYKKEKEEKVILAEQKENDSKMLQKKLVERKKLLASIRHDKTELKKSINSKRSAESKIKNLIAKLIDTEERKKKEEHERLVKLESAKVRNEIRTKSISSEMKDVNNDAVYDINISTSELSSFSSLKGKLNWPVSGGHIVRHFGEDRNAKLNTVTLTYGVDIKAGSDLNIKTPADGVVSAIDWIPGYGGVIIITHKDGYRTVYSHFSEIFVKEGDKVNAGSVIAKIGESIEGYIVHFEIWYSRNNQNPEIWLARK